MYLSPDLFDEPLVQLTAAQQVTSSNLKQHIQMLAGEIGARSLTSAPAGLKKAADYIENTFSKMGYQPGTQEFKAEVFFEGSRNLAAPESHLTSNIVAQNECAGSPDDVLIVGAHYDTEYESPGANDNGTGVAALLEIARIVQSRNRTSGRTVKFVAFSNEEQPFCRTEQMGSRQYALLCKKQNVQIKAMICLETIGFFSNKPGSQNYPDASFDALKHDRANFIAFVSNVASEPLLKLFAEAFKASVRFPSIAIAASESIRGIDYSDHQNFWQLDYPALMITDTAFYRYPHYHALTDTPDKIDYVRLALLTSAIAESILELSKI